MLFKYALPAKTDPVLDNQELYKVKLDNIAIVLTNGDSVEAAIANAKVWYWREFVPAYTQKRADFLAERKKAAKKCTCENDDDDPCEACECADGSKPRRREKPFPHKAVINAVELMHYDGRLSSLSGVYIVDPILPAKPKRKYTRQASTDTKKRKLAKEVLRSVGIR